MSTIERLVPKWKTILTPPLSAAENMAVDLGLMERARKTGEGVFRVYSWKRPSLSLGRNQTAMGRYNLEMIGDLSLDVVRRPTGGRAILHWREITYSVTAPSNGEVGLKQAYKEINRILLSALANLGVPVEVAIPTERAQRPSSMPCFAAPGEGEMIVDGRKLVGSAQWRDEGALLQHGSILIEDDQSRLSEIMVEKVTIPEVGTLASLMDTPPTVQDLSSAVEQILEEDQPGDVSPLEVDEALEWGADHISHFSSPEWTWRR